MPPKRIDGNWILPHGGRLVFADGSPVVITEAKLPPEPGGEPPDFGLHEMSFSAECFMPRAQWKRMVKSLRKADNRMERIVRTLKRRREKERRRRLKEVNNG